MARRKIIEIVRQQNASTIIHGSKAIGLTSLLPNSFNSFQENEINTYINSSVGHGRLPNIMRRLDRRCQDT